MRKGPIVYCCNLMVSRFAKATAYGSDGAAKTGLFMKT